MSKLSRAEKKRRRVPANSALMVRIGGFFNRRPDTLWSLEEWEALQQAGGAETADWDLLERFYESGGRGYLIPRKDLLTLLNNLPGEEDKARKWERGEGDRDGRKGGNAGGGLPEL